MAPEDNSINVGNITNSSYFAIGHNARLIVIQQLVQGLGDLPTHYDGPLRNFLDYYLGTPGQPAPFGGRQAEINLLNTWLDDPDTPHYAFLAAPAGRGKSALLAQWVAQLQQRSTINIVFFPISIRYSTNRESVVFAALYARLAHLYDEKAAQAMEAQLYSSLVSDYLRRPAPNGRPILLVIDALDEAAGWEIAANLFPTEPPAHLRVLLSARYRAGDGAGRGWLAQLGWEMPKRIFSLSLNALDREGVADILSQMGNPLERFAVNFDLVTRLYELSEGDPLMIRLYVEALQSDGTNPPIFKPQDLLTLQPGLDSYFNRWWNEQQQQWGSQRPLRDRAVRGMLNLCATAFGPLSKADILGIAPDYLEDSLLIGEVVRPLNRFIVGEGTTESGYVLSHPRLNEFFAGLLSGPERDRWRERFINYGRMQLLDWEAGKLKPEAVSVYASEYFSAHLAQAKLKSELYELVLNQNWFHLSSAHDPSNQSYISDLELSFSTALEDLQSTLPEAIANCFIQATLSGLSKNLPFEIYETLLRLGRREEAFKRVATISDLSQQTLVARKLVAVADLIGLALPPEIAKRYQDSDLPAKGTPLEDEPPAWVVHLVRNHGIQEALQQLSQTRSHSRSGTHLLNHYLEVAKAAVVIGKNEDAHQLLLECLELIAQVEGYERRNYLLKVAVLLIQLQFDSEVLQIIQLTRAFEFEIDRIIAASQLALICSDSPNNALRQEAVALAVDTLKNPTPIADLQIPLSWIALAMVKIGDSRGSDFLQQAIHYAQRPQQATWIWQEREAWTRCAASLAFIGLTEEALSLVGSKGLLEQPAAEQIVSVLLLKGDWDPAFELAQGLHPIARRRTLLRVGGHLATGGKLPPEQYKAILDLVGADLDEKTSVMDQLEIYSGLIELCLRSNDYIEAKQNTARMMGLIEKSNGELNSRWLTRVSAHASRIHDLQLEERIVTIADWALDETPASATIKTIVYRNLARLDTAWQLAQAIPDQFSQLQELTTIAKDAFKRGQQDGQYLESIAELANTQKNVGFIPIIWSRVAKLAHDLGKPVDEVDTFIERALEGAQTLDPDYHVESNIFAITEIGEQLLELGYRERAKELLEFGLTCFQTKMASVDPLLRFIEVAGKAQFADLWEPILEVARTHPDLPQQARIFIKILSETSNPKDELGFNPILNETIERVLTAGSNEFLLTELSRLFQQMANTDCETLSQILVKILSDIRMRERPAVLDWVACLLPVLQTCSPGRGKDIWVQLLRAEKVVLASQPYNGPEP